MNRREDGRIGTERLAVGPPGTSPVSDGIRANWETPAASVHVGTTAPASPATGQLWYDTDATC